MHKHEEHNCGAHFFFFYLIFHRHWIAVFGQVFERKIKTTVENLRKHFSGSGGKGDKWRYYGRALRASTKLYYYVLIYKL